MKINNRIETSGGDSRYVDTRDVKASKDGIKVRLYGEAFMGFSYFQKQDDDSVKVIRSEKRPVMVNPTEGYQGEAQTPATCFYVLGWDYNKETPVLLTIDKVAIIKEFMAVNDNEDLDDITNYDFKISFDNTKAPAEKYKVVRLDKSSLTPSQIKALKDFSKTCDIKSYRNGGEAFEKKDITEEAF